MTDIIIQMAEAELETLSANYESWSEELRLARKFGTKEEIENLKRLEELTWARYDQMSTFLANVKYEMEKVGA